LRQTSELAAALQQEVAALRESAERSVVRGEGLGMCIEEWRGVAHNLQVILPNMIFRVIIKCYDKTYMYIYIPQTSAIHASSYTRFLEEQLLEAKRSSGMPGGTGRLGTGHSMRANLNTPKSTFSGFEEDELDEPSSPGKNNHEGWVIEEGVLSLDSLPMSGTFKGFSAKNRVARSNKRRQPQVDINQLRYLIHILNVSGI